MSTTAWIWQHYLPNPYQINRISLLCAMAKSTLDKAIQYDEAYNKEEDMESDRRLALLMEEQKARSVCSPTL